MGTVFKKTVTKPLPAGAEVVEQRGRPLARWKDNRKKTRTAPVTQGRDGSTRMVVTVSRWYCRYRDHRGVEVERPTGCRDEAAARQVLADFERREERVRAGLLTPAEDRISRHQAAPLDRHLGDYIGHLKAADTSPVHRADTLRYLIHAPGDTVRLPAQRRPPDSVGGL
jgi:hypothetical protein